MSGPAISVVVPVHDAAATIAATLESVCRQTIDPRAIEIILVEDGSTDDGLAIAEATLAARDRRALVCRHDRPGGPSAARNRGWRIARGAWIQFLDADDLLEPTKCAVQWADARDADATVAAVCSPWGRTASAGDTVHPSERGAVTAPRFGDDLLMDVLRADNFLMMGSYLVRRTMLERVGGFDEALWLVEDVDLLMRIVLAGGRFQVTDGSTPLLWYRERTGSLSRRNRRDFIDACLRNARRAEHAWRAANALTGARRHFLATLYFQGARFLAEHDARAFEDVVAHIYELDPEFVPEEPRALRRLARVLGYRASERLAVRYRRVKRAVGL